MVGMTHGATAAVAAAASFLGPPPAATAAAAAAAVYICRFCVQLAASASLAIRCFLCDRYFWRWLAMLWRVRHSMPMSSRILDGTALSIPSCSTACTNRRCNSGVQSTFTLRLP